MAPKKGKGKKAAESDEEKRLRLEMASIKAQEEQNQRELKMRNQFKTWLTEEQKFSKLNTNKIQNQWRKLMRIAKVDSLRKHLEIMSQDHEREVDVKDAIIQMLDRDLDEAEEQYQTALRSHLQNVDGFVALQRQKVRDIEHDFERELAEIESEFDTERDHISTKHRHDMNELKDMMNMIQLDEEVNEAEARQEFDSLCEEIRNKNLEDLNVLKLTLENSIEDLERHFESAHQNYIQSTEPRSVSFKQLTDRDNQASTSIQSNFKKIQRLTESLASWKLKINGNIRECEERNKFLKLEKDQVSSHFQSMKSKMNRVRAAHNFQLQDLAIRSRTCIQHLEEQKKRAECILSLAELARKLETEKEKIMPFNPLGGDVGLIIAADMKEDLTSLTTYARTHDGKVLEEWNYLDQFFKVILFDNIIQLELLTQLHRK
jgi:hypothetical protein